MTLLRFGLEYGFHTEGEYNRKKFWRAIKNCCTNSIRQVKGETEAILDMVGMMKAARILSRKSMRETAHLMEEIENFTATQIAEFTLIYASTEMQRAIDISDNLGRLEASLIAKSEQFTVNEFAMVCSVVTFEDAYNDASMSFNLGLPVFLHENKHRVIEWLENDSFDDMQDFVSVTNAYFSLYEEG